MCSQCDGTGRTEIVKRICVDLPPLPGDLSCIRVAGAGLYDEDSGGFGDLRCVCHVVPQDGIELVDGHLRVTLAVAPERQSQGGRFEVALPEETLAVDLPGPLTQGDLYEFELASPSSDQTRLLVVEVSTARSAGDAQSRPLHPDEVNRLHAEALNAEKSRDFEGALLAYRQLSEHSPDARVLRKCGWMCLRLDDLNAAAEYMQRAVDQDWSNGEAHYYKGAVHHKRREPLLAAVEMEHTARLGLDVKQAEIIRRASLLDVFAAPAGAPAEAHERFSGLISEAINRYYGVAAAACRDLLRDYPESGVYYQFGAAAWLASISGDEERLAEAYLGLRAASAMAPDSEDYAAAFSSIQHVVDRSGIGAPHATIAAYLLQEGDALGAAEHASKVRESLLECRLATDREAATLEEAAAAALAACGRMVESLQPTHGLWERALAATVSACDVLDGLIAGVTAADRPIPWRSLQSASKNAVSLARDQLIPVCAGLQDHIEQRRRDLPSRCHGWLETIIRESSALRQSLRAASRLTIANAADTKAGVRDEPLERLSRAIQSLRDNLQTQYTYLDQSLCATWRAWSHLLHARAMISQHVGRDDFLDRCRQLARAVALEQVAGAMRPEEERSIEQRRDTCRLLDDFQETAQAAAGTDAFARAEFFQNTIDSLRGELVPGRSLAENPQDLLQERKIELFDWACDVLFKGTTAFPQEFLIDACRGSYAVTNYRLAHRQTDATTFLSIPLTAIQRYDVRASGATTRAVTLTLGDGRRITFNDVPAEHVLDRERMSWLLAARMWKTLTEAELEALDANRPAPTSQLPAEAILDRRRLLGDTRQSELGEGDQTVVCRQCGRHNFRMDRFCRDCGTQLGEAREQSLPASDAPALPQVARSREDGDQHALS